jgi:hypothetical protein
MFTVPFDPALTVVVPSVILTGIYHTPVSPGVGIYISSTTFYSGSLRNPVLASLCHLPKNIAFLV